jgi:hypothetical protein
MCQRREILVFGIAASEAPELFKVREQIWIGNATVK